jgi:hypothetical protein
MRKKKFDLPDRARLTLAQEAARLIVDHGMRDYRSAKIKAAEKLGMRTYGALPGNEEIELAVSDHLQLFGREAHGNFLMLSRQVGLSAMQLLSAFRPRLVGPALSGTADANSPVELHLFSDSPDRVAMYLSDIGVSYKAYDRRMKSRRDKIDAFAGFAFVHNNVAIEATVFPVDGIRQAPISPIDGRPMKRADMKAVEKLIERL